MKKKNLAKYDLIIIGAGPAGLTAAIYAARYRLNVLVLGKLIGGLASEAYHICNFPSYEQILGFNLMQKMAQQVKSLKIEIKSEEVLEIIGEDKNFKVKTKDKEYSCKKIILATGGERKKLGLEKEKELTGKGVSYCATCDAPLYKGKSVAVVGGSNAALTTALLLSGIAREVYIIYRQESFFRAEPAWVEEIKKIKKIKPLFSSEVIKLNGKENLDSVEIKKIDKKMKLKINGLFVEIGSIPQNLLAKKNGIRIEEEYISVDKRQRTSKKGIFAAGDITNNPLKQIITACAEGALSADSAYREIINPLK